MSARTLMVNEGILQELEKRIGELRRLGGELVKAMNGSKVAFSDGMNLLVEYSGSLQVLQEFSKQVFSGFDLCDPEDNELQSREEEDEEDGDDEEDGEDEDSEDGGDDEN